MQQSDGSPLPLILQAYRWATEQLYGPLAWAYDAVAWVVSFGYWSNWRLDTLVYLKPGAILETGFGTGELLIALAEAGHDVTGLEPSPQMHRVTQRKLRKKKLTVKKVCGKSEAMPFKTGKFNTIVSTFPSNYIFRTNTLQEIHRVLERDGRCVVLGLGARFESGFKRWVTGFWLDGGTNPILQQLVHKAESIGLKAICIDHQGDGYTLPVLVLERYDRD